MKQNFFRFIAGIIGPIIAYLLVANIATLMIALFLPYDQTHYIWIALGSNCVTLPFVYWYFKEQIHKPGKKILKPKMAMLSIAAAVVWSVGLNQVVFLTELSSYSGEYQKTSAYLYGGSTVALVLSAGILVPIIEELLYRGIIYNRIKEQMGKKGAVVCAAVVFGGMHGNLVQFLYAGLLAVLLIFLYEKTGTLKAPMLAHMAANLASIVNSKTSLLQGIYENSQWLVITTVSELVIGAIIILYMQKSEK